MSARHLGKTACDDPYMLVEVEKTAEFSGVLFWSRSGLLSGHAAVRWCGAPDIPSGQYHVEWTIDEEIVWGHPG
jgi:hypothetical protein